jgi:hypothetical protein
MTAVQDRISEADEAVELDDVESRSRRRLPSVQLPRWLAADSAVPLWLGLIVSAFGFILLLVAWSQVAGETQVYLQLPYLVSAGLTGLALIMVGLTVINVVAKRRDAAERARQIDQLVSILEEVRGAVSSRGARRR